MCYGAPPAPAIDPAKVAEALRRAPDPEDYPSPAKSVDPRSAAEKDALELEILGICSRNLSALDAAGRARVLDYLTKRWGGRP